MAVTAAGTDSVFEASGSVEVNGAMLAYRELGAGEPVVFVHGGLSDLRTWQQQLPAVAHSYRAISYSRRYARPNEDIEPAATTRCSRTSRISPPSCTRSAPRPRIWSATPGAASSAC